MSQPPQRLKDLFDLAKHSIGLPIRFTRLLPDDSNTSAVEVNEKEVLIEVRENLAPDVEENTIAHELAAVSSRDSERAY